MSRNKTERQEAIAIFLEAAGNASLAELTDRFVCSEATMRRDLEELERSGRVIRTLGGGAAYAGAGFVREVPFREKQGEAYGEKLAIAALAASMVQDGDVIGLTGGTTTFLIAKALKQRSRITIVTNAVNIAMELADAGGVQVVLSGGVMRGSSFELCGPLAEQSLRAVNIHLMFLGIDGITEQGVSTYSELEANIASLMMKRSDRTIAVFDRTKAGRSSLFHVAELSELGACITDGPLPAALGKALAAAGAAVHLAAGAEHAGQGVRAR